jgi:hypothetical protein
MNKDIEKFNGTLTKLRSIPRSGWNCEKYKEETLKLYKIDVKDEFKLLACRVYLKNPPKCVNIHPDVAQKAVMEAAA